MVTVWICGTWGVYRGTTVVVTDPYGQFWTDGGHEVIVSTSVVYTVETPPGGAGAGVTAGGRLIAVTGQIVT